MPKVSEALIVCAVAGSGASSAVVDLYTRRVPNRLTIGVAALGLALAAVKVSGVSLAGALAGFVLGLLLMLPAHLIAGTGAGDVKLFAAFGTLLGPTRIAAAFVYTALAGGALALFIAWRRQRLTATVERTAALVRTGGGNVADIERPTENNRFAYAPAIAIGTLAAVLGL